MNQDLYTKLVNEEELTVQDQLLLDSSLYNQADTIGSLVSELEDESLSLAWRSQLNERLRPLFPRPRVKVSLLRKLQFGSISLAVVASLLFALPLMKGNEASTAVTVESVMVVAHQENVHRYELAGTSAREANEDPSLDVGDDWQESDLGVL